MLYLFLFLLFDNIFIFIFIMFLIIHILIIFLICIYLNRLIDLVMMKILRTRAQWPKGLFQSTCKHGPMLSWRDQRH